MHLVRSLRRGTELVTSVVTMSANNVPFTIQAAKTRSGTSWLRVGGRWPNLSLAASLGEPPSSEVSLTCVLGSPSSSATWVFRRLTDASRLAPCDSGRVANRSSERLFRGKGGAREQHKRLPPHTVSGSGAYRAQAGNPAAASVGLAQP